MKKFLIIAAISLSAVLTGCAATTGNGALAEANDSTIAQHIVKGRSTQQDVRAYLGAPDDVSFSGNDHAQQWQYEVDSTKASATSYIPVVGLFSNGTTVHKKLLTILFNQKGTVSDYTYADSHRDYHNGISN